VALFSRRKPNVRRLKRKGDVEGLAGALHYREAMVDEDGAEWDLGMEVRVEAARALSQLNASAVADDLAQALGDPQPEVQLAVIDALAAFGAPVAVEPLLDCALRDDGPSDVSARAIEVLEGWRIPDGTELLVDRLLMPDAPPLTEEHGELLERMLYADPRGDGARRTVAERVIWKLDGPREPGVEERAERVLGWLGQPAMDRVNEALANGAARPALVRVAGVSGDARSIEAVVGALTSPDPEMRRSAALAAGALKHTQTVPELLGLTQDPEQSVRDAASTALNQIGMAAVIVGLASLMEPVQPGRDGDGAAAAAEAPGDGAQLPPEPPPPPPPPPEPAAAAQAPPPAAWRPRRGGLLERLLGRIE
jgi:HEAT repeat protein